MGEGEAEGEGGAAGGEGTDSAPRASVGGGNGGGGGGGGGVVRLVTCARGGDVGFSLRVSHVVAAAVFAACGGEEIGRATVRRDGGRGQGQCITC